MISAGALIPKNDFKTHQPIQTLLTGNLIKPSEHDLRKIF